MIGFKDTGGVFQMPKDESTDPVQLSTINGHSKNSMTGLHLTLAPLIILTWSVGAQDEPSKPTPGAIREFVDNCISRNVPIDLVKKFGTDFRGLDLRGIEIKGVYRIGAETILSGADFSGADLRDLDFGAAILDGASFRNADLRGARFTTAKFDQADLTGAVIGDAHFQECFFNGAKLTGLDFSRAILSGCYFTKTNLDGATLQGVGNDLGWRREITGSSLREVNLSGFDFSLGNLSGTDFAGANLTGANFTQTNLSQANLAGTILDDAVFDAAILDGVTGLDAATLQAIRTVADRAGFEAREAAKARAERIRKSVFTWSYLAIVPCAFLCCGLAWRCSTEKVWPLTLILVNFVAVIPALFFLALNHYADELIARSSHIDIGRTWIMIWPLSVLGALAMIIGGLILAVVFGKWAKGKKNLRTRAAPMLAAVAATIVHGAFLLVYSFQNAPSV